MNLTINGLSVDPVLESVRLEKHRNEAAATLIATLWTAAADTFFLHLSLAVGDVVRLTDEQGAERFLGSIHALERTPEQVRLIAFDKGVFLARNEVNGVFAGNGAEICRTVAQRLGIAAGTLEADGAYQIIPALAGENAYALLRKAAGQGREVTVEEDALVVRKVRPVTVLLPTEQILEISAEADIRTMVNRCRIVDYRGRQVASAQNAADMAAYGAFGVVYGKNGTDPQQQAKNALTGRKKRAEVVLLGNAGYFCGAKVLGQQPQWGLEGEYVIMAVTHRWEAGLFTTELSLEGVE